MTLMCQQDSYLKEFNTVVKSCSPGCVSLVEDGKKTKVQGFHVVLDDTILFPEGGGQPDDRGLINGIPVIRITRQGSDAVHFTKSEIQQNTEVNLQLDWSRRFDFMQQHTAQHLVTATTDRLLGCGTTSWNIGTDIVTIEVDTTLITMEQMAEIEKAVNESIRNDLAVHTSVYQDKHDPDLKKFRRLGLPADHEGSVRVVTIEGVDDAFCCGTHVLKLSHIQAVKLLYVEKGKKGKVNLSFLAGDRLLKYVGESYHREKTLTGILKGPADKHCELADKAVKGMKAMQKACFQQLREIATFEAAMFKQSPEKDKVFVKHRKDGDNDYISVLIGELGDENLPKLITVGDKSGMFVLSGSDQLVKDIGSKICDLFEGKGAPNKGMFRGKANNLANRMKAEKFLRDYLTSQAQGDTVKED